MIIERSILRGRVAVPSLAVTFTPMVPISEFDGLPWKDIVSLSRISHEGSEEPFDRVAE